MPNYPKIGLIAFLDTAAFSRGLSTYTRGLTQLNLQTTASSTSAGAAFMGLGSNVVKFAGITAAAIGAVALAAGGVAAKLSFDAVKTSTSIEDAFAGVVKTAGNLTSSYGVLNEQGRELKETLIGLSLVKPMPIEEIMNVAQIGAQAGIKTSMLPEFTSTLVDLISASDMSAESAATKVAQLMNIMQLGAGDVAALGSSIAALGNNFAGTEEEAIVLGQRIAGMGHAVGMTTQDIMGLATAMIAVGVRSEAGGTAVQRVLMAMQAAVSATGTGIIDNTAAMGKSTVKMEKYAERVLELNDKIAVQEQRIAEQTDKTKESTRMQRQNALAGYQRDLAALQRGMETEGLSLETLAANNGRTFEMMGDDLALFAKLAGMTSREFGALFQADPGGAMEQFVIGLGKTGDEAGAVLKSLGLGDARLIRSFTQLAGSEGLLTDAMNVSNIAWLENTALTNEAEERYATLASQIDILKNHYRAFQDAIGDPLKPAVRQIVNMFKDIDVSGGKVVKFFENRFGPALEDVAIAIRLAFGGDRTGALGALKAAFVMMFGGETTRRIYEFFDKVDSVVKGIRDFVIKYSDEIRGAIKGVLVLLASSAIVSIVAGIVGGLMTPLTALILAAAALGVAWETNWLGIQDKVREVIAVVGPEIETFVANLATWFNDTLKPRIEAGDWVGVGRAIWTQVVTGVESATAVGTSLDQLLRGWLTSSLGIPALQDPARLSELSEEEQKIANSQAASWRLIGATIMANIIDGFGDVQIIGGNLSGQLANAVGKAMNIEPIINSDTIQESVEGQIGWGQIGLWIGKQILGGIRLYADWLSGFYEDFSDWADHEGEGGKAAFDVGVLLARMIGTGIVSLWQNKEYLGELAVEFGKSLTYALLGGMKLLAQVLYGAGIGLSQMILSAFGIGATTDEITAALDEQWAKLSRRRSLKDRWQEDFFPEDAFTIESIINAAGEMRGKQAPGAEAGRTAIQQAEENRALHEQFNTAYKVAQEDLAMKAVELGVACLLPTTNLGLFADNLQTTGSSLGDIFLPLSLYAPIFTSELQLTTEAMRYWRTATIEQRIEIGAAIADLRIGVGTWQRWVASMATAQPSSESNYGPARASGGWVNTLVGERGREIVSIPAGSYVHNNRMTEGMLSGGMNININVSGGEASVRQQAKIGVLEGLDQYGIKYP